MGAFSRFVRPETKLFALKFTHILQVICLQVLQKKFWVQFHNFCVQKRSCLLGTSDAFWKVSACKIDKSCGHTFTIYVSPKQTFLTSTFVKLLWPRSIICTPIDFCWVVWAHCEVLDFHIL